LASVEKFRRDTIGAGRPVFQPESMLKRVRQNRYVRQLPFSVEHGVRESVQITIACSKLSQYSVARPTTGTSDWRSESGP
jgi:hypothetical protein